MKPSQLSGLLAQAISSKLKVLIKGKPGVGKSDIVEAAAKLAGADLVLSHPAVSDPTDYKGMPAITNGGTEAHFLPFGDLKKLIDASKLTVCFMDDIGQAPHGVQAALMQLILARRVNGHRISDHVVFMGATNDTSHRAGVHSILEPVKSRWHTIVELEPNVDDWCDWAYAHGMPDEIIGFIKFRPEFLCKFEPSRELVNSPSPRTVAAVGQLVNAGITDHEAISGAAGEGFAAEFLGFLKVFRALPNIESILRDPQMATVPDEPTALYAVTAALVRKLTGKDIAAVMTYAARLPKEFEVCLIRDAQRTNKDLVSSPLLTAWIHKNSKHLLP